jgi:hypothetical protein
MKINPITLTSITSMLQEGFEEELERLLVAPQLWVPRKLQKTHNERNGRYVNSIFNELGAYYVWRAYRMESLSY